MVLVVGVGLGVEDEGACCVVVLDVGDGYLSGLGAQGLEGLYGCFDRGFYLWV